MPVLKVLGSGSVMLGVQDSQQGQLKPVLGAPDHCSCLSPELEGQNNSTG